MDTIEVKTSVAHADSLRDMLKSEPGLRFSERGWIVKDFTITGPREQIAALRPRIEKWEHDCISRDAW